MEDMVVGEKFGVYLARGGSGVFDEEWKNAYATVWR